VKMHIVVKCGGGGAMNFAADIVLPIECIILSSDGLYGLSFGGESRLKPNMTRTDLLRKK